jgi:hypothetical protein
MYLGPLGMIQTLPEPEQAPTIERAQEGGIHQLLSGHRAVDDTLFRPRNWTLSWEVLTEEEFSLLSSIRQKAFGPPPFALIDPQQRNYFTGNQSGGGDPLGTTEGWALVSGTSLGVSRAQQHTGLKSFQWIVTANNQDVISGAATTVTGALTDLYKDIPVVPGLVYMVSMWVRPNAASTSLQMRFAWHDRTGAFISTTGAATNALTANTWQQIQSTSTAPTNAAFVRVRLTATTVTTNPTTIWFDDAMLEQNNAVSNWAIGQGPAWVGPFAIHDSYPWLGYHQVSIDLLEL